MDALRIPLACLAIAALLLAAGPAPAAPAKKAKATPAKAEPAPAKAAPAAEAPAPKEEPAPAPKTKPRPAATPAPAAAPAPASPVAGLELGFAGMLGAGSKGTLTSVRWGTAKEKIRPSGGLGIHALYQVLPYLDVGGRFAILWWQTKENLSDSVPVGNSGTLFDISAMVKAKGRFLDDRLEVYGKFPVGLTVSLLEKLDFVRKGRAGVGANVGVLGGASWTFLQHYGIFLELGYTFHWVRHTLGFDDVTRFLTGVDADTQKYQAHEFALNLGFAYRF